LIYGTGALEPGAVLPPLPFAAERDRGSSTTLHVIRAALQRRNQIRFNDPACNLCTALQLAMCLYKLQ
jgi:hypothetical protein